MNARKKGKGRQKKRAPLQKTRQMILTVKKSTSIGRPRRPRITQPMIR